MEYKISTDGRTIAFIWAGVLITGGAVLALYTAAGNVPHNLTILALVFSVLFILTGAYLAYDTAKIKLVITDTQVELTHAFTYRVFLLTDVKGYRTAKNSIFLVLKDGNKAVLLPKNVQDIDNIVVWAKNNFKEANKIIIAEEKEAVAADENFGASTEERLRRLTTANYCTYTLNVIAVMFSIISIFIFKPVPVLWAILFAFPCLAILLVWRFKGLIKVDFGKVSAYPSILTTILASSLSAVVNALSRYEVYEYGLLLNYTAEATAVMVIVAYIIAFTNGKYFKKRLVLIAWSIVFASLYSFGGTILLNCYYDKTTPQVFKEPVIDKYILHGKNTSYDIYIPAWGKYKTRQYFSVGKAKYSTIKLGDTVFVYLYGGRLHIPWYRLSLN